jgi:hypothetical protein
MIIYVPTEDLITCYCNRPYAGRPMVECDRCLTWIHITCTNLKRRDRVPEVWNCYKCETLLPPPTNSSSESPAAAFTKPTTTTGSSRRKSKTSRKRSSTSAFVKSSESSAAAAASSAVVGSLNGNGFHHKESGKMAKRSS